jgi:hypothetical protein
MATLQEMQAQRAKLLQEIQRRGGAAKAPGFASQLTALDAQIRQARTTPTTTPVTPAPVNTQRVQTRIDYLKRVDPRSAEIAQLQKKLAPVNPVTPPPATGGGGPLPPNPPAQNIEAFVNSIFDNAKPLDLSGAPQILTDNDLLKTRQGAYDSLLSSSTETFERDKARDMEAQKQELAQRGIPYDPSDPSSLYGRTVGGVNERYDGMYRQAKDAANIGADSRLSALVGANTAANDAFTQRAMAEFESQWTAMEPALAKYGIDEEKKLALKKIQADKWIAKIAARSRGGSGGGGTAPDTSPVIGGTAPGFQV